MKTVLVTGANGYIGKAVTRELTSQGFNVISMVRDRSKGEVLGNIVVADITNYESLVRALKDVDTVVHLAALKVDEKDSYKVNVAGAENLVKACIENRVEEIVNISSSSTKIKKKGLYAETKNSADRIIQSSPLKSITLKPSVVYSDTQAAVFGSLAKFAKLPVTPVIGNGKCKFYPIHLDDLAKVIGISVKKINTLDNNYDIGGPDTLEIDQIIKEISEKVFEKNKTYLIHIPASAGIFLAKLFSFFFKNPPITESNVLGSTQNIDWNKEKMFNDFGFVPMSFSEGIKRVRSEYLRTEADILYSYVNSTSGLKFRIDDTLRDRYFRALKANGIKGRLSISLMRKPFLIGPVDAFTKIFKSQSEIQRRLLVTAALTECSTQSASWLLPKDRSRTVLFFEFIKIGLSTTWKVLFGLILAMFGFIQRHAR